MDIFINGNIVSLFIKDKSLTILEIKQMIEKSKGISVDKQLLFFPQKIKGNNHFNKIDRYLGNDNAKLSNYGVTSGK